MKVDKIAILDCGGQYLKVIDRKVRELGVKTDIFPVNCDVEKLKEYDGIILSGGPGSVWAESAIDYNHQLLELNIPVLGICYGMHLINKHFGGTVATGRVGEYGEIIIDIEPGCPLFTGLDKKQKVLMSHQDEIVTIAPGFKKCSSSDLITAAISNEKLKIYGVQFHPEVDLTINGKKMLENFLKQICQLEGNYILDDRIEIAIKNIKEKVKDEKIIVLVSGGVDSAVSAVLLLKALPAENVYGIHIDHGLMRKYESDIVCRNLQQLGFKNFLRVNAEDTFLNSVLRIDNREIGPLTHIIDPEDKRNLIGNIFLEVVREAARGFDLNFDTTFWAQGTLRPDLIESGNPDVSTTAHKIKTHHNDVEFIRAARAKGLVAETNWDWHKDEVRKVARKLGIHPGIAERQPFPGPGLALRVICYQGDRKFPSIKQEEFREKMKRITGDYDTAVLPIKSVGVQGDYRSYKNLVILSGNKMEFQWDEIYDIGKKIPNRVGYVNRVAYVLNKNINTDDIECYDFHINKKSLHLLRDLDDLIVNRLKDCSISQTLVLLLPCGRDNKYSVGIRTFITNDFMTGSPAVIGKDIDKTVLESLVKEIEDKFTEIDLILYDITGKPPATVEWQ